MICLLAWDHSKLISFIRVVLFSYFSFWLFNSFSQINTTTEEKDPSNPFRFANIGVEKFLELNSEQNHDQYCLAYVFTDRDFDDGVLGLAWVGAPSGWYQAHTQSSGSDSLCCSEAFKVFGCFVTHLHITSIIIFAIMPVIHTIHYTFFLISLIILFFKITLVQETRSQF